MKRLGFLPEVEDEIQSVRYLEMVALTVQVDEKLAERAKRAAERRKITVDVMVGQYFAQLPNDDRDLPPLSRSLRTLSQFLIDLNSQSNHFQIPH